MLRLSEKDGPQAADAAATACIDRALPSEICGRIHIILELSTSDQGLRLSPMFHIIQSNAELPDSMLNVSNTIGGLAHFPYP